jgi:hypothetical protein
MREQIFRAKLILCLTMSLNFSNQHACFSAAFDERVGLRQDVFSGHVSDELNAQ